MMFKGLFKPKESVAETLYGAIVAAARRPLPYAAWGVPDTVEGRFDMIILHLYLVLDRLKGASGDPGQPLVDAFFKDMDRSLREMGVSDIAVGKKVRKMAEAFYGRVLAYDKAAEQGADELAAAVARNLFPEGTAGEAPARLAAYMLAERQRLAACETAVILAGKAGFSEMAP